MGAGSASGKSMTPCKVKCRFINGSGFEKEFIVLYISDADLLTFDPLGACTGTFIQNYMDKWVYRS